MDERARLRMHSERSVPDEVEGILAAGRVAHLGFEVDGQPYVIPMLYHYEPPAGGRDDRADGGRRDEAHAAAAQAPRKPDGAAATSDDGAAVRGGRLILHGSTKSRAMTRLASGAPVCVTVTHLDQLVYSKTALDHSANYRSAVCFGKGRLIEDAEEKNELLERMVGRYFEGRTSGVDYQRATSQHLKATLVVEVEIEAASGKARRGDPNGPDDDDPEALGTAGLLDV